MRWRKGVMKISLKPGKTPSSKVSLHLDQMQAMPQENRGAGSLSTNHREAV
jgi:hypothetical protein